MIVSDAYKIPNLWVRASDGIIGGNFKYHDYFSGVGRAIIEPVILNEDITIEFLLMKIEEYVPIEYNCELLMGASPVQIKKKFRYQ